MNQKETKEKVLEAFNFRYACKEFDSERKISDEDFKFILETGRLSPSSLGLEPWHFVIIQNYKLREKLKCVSWGAQGQLPTASHYIVILCRNKEEMTYDSKYIDRMMRIVHKIPDDLAEARRNKIEDYQKNDAKMFDTKDGIFQWACRQTYIAMGNMMTSAAMIGIDSCPIEGYNQKAVEEILEEEGILDKSKFGISSMVAFGYRKKSPKREKTRQSLEDIVTYIK